jgi:hypothetical protein
MLERGAKIYPATQLTYAGQPSTFGGEIAVTEPGRYLLDLYAYDPATGNTGMARFALTVN